MSGESPKTQPVLPSNQEDSSGASPSQLWKNRYLIEKELARGGFGIVYLARDQQLMSKPVVIKVLLENVNPDPYVQKKFRQEIEALSRIDHPGIVGVLDVGETPDAKPFLVMQFVEGTTLRALIREGGMKLGQASRILNQVCQALTAAHEKGVFHRDLKPENIMLQNLAGGEIQVKLIDFGIAAVKDSQVSQTQTSMVVGTLAYMAPEQVLGKASQASDIYALGVISFEMVTGQRPDNSPQGVSVKPRELRADVPAAVEEVILRALSFRPEERQQQPRDFGDQFVAACGGASSTTAIEPVLIPGSEPDADSSAAGLEMAYVLFMDLVGYSNLPMDQQSRRIQKLQDLVRDTPEFKQASKNEQLISLPTGDGMALVFFQNPVTPVQCAARISKVLRNQPDLKLRMGVHTGPVYRIADINTNRNVAGGGINLAQRVMDCGDSGHILVSKAVADVLGQLSDWTDSLHDLGEAEVKHGVKIHVVNLYSNDVGNSTLPAKLAKRPVEEVRPQTIVASLPPAKGGKGVWIGLASGAAVVVLAGAVFYSGILSRAPASPEPPPGKVGGTPPPAGPEPPAPQPGPAPGGGLPQPAIGQVPRDPAPPSNPRGGTAPVSPGVPEKPGATPEIPTPTAPAPPPPTPAPAPAPAPIAPQAAVAADPPGLQEQRERLGQLSARASSILSSMQRMEQQQNRQGLSMRGDMATARSSMEYLIGEAKANLDRRNVDAAKRNLSLAEPQIEKLEAFLGR